MTSLERVLCRYQATVLRYLNYKFGVPQAEAEDLWQGFILGRILERQFLSQADPERGRFRAFLLRSLDRHVISQRRRAAAQKRSPGQDLVPLDGLSEAELPQTEESERDSEMIWAQAVIAGALLNMRLECERSLCMPVWGVFEGRILDAILEDSPPMPYGQLIERFGFRSPTQAFNALVTAKRMFKRHLRRVIADYAADDRGAEEELSDLRHLVRRFE